MLIASLITLISMLLWCYRRYYLAVIVIAFGTGYVHYVIKLSPGMVAFMFMVFFAQTFAIDLMEKQDKNDENDQCFR